MCSQYVWRPVAVKWEWKKRRSEKSVDKEQRRMKEWERKKAHIILEKK